MATPTSVSEFPKQMLRQLKDQRSGAAVEAINSLKFHKDKAVLALLGRSADARLV